MLTWMGGGRILCDLGCLHAFHTEPVCALSRPSKVEFGPCLQNPFESQEANQSVWSELVYFSSDTAYCDRQLIYIHLNFVKQPSCNLQRKGNQQERNVWLRPSSLEFSTWDGEVETNRGGPWSRKYMWKLNISKQKGVLFSDSYKTPSCNSFLLPCVPEKLHLTDPEVSRQLWTWAVSSCSWREFSQN